MANFDYPPRRTSAAGRRHVRWGRGLLAIGFLAAIGAAITLLAPGGSTTAPKGAMVKATAAPQRLEVGLSIPDRDAGALSDVSLEPAPLPRKATPPAKDGISDLRVETTTVPRNSQPPEDVSVAPSKEAAHDPVDAGGNAEPARPPQGEGTWRELTVERGDNLAALFKRAGLTPRDVYDVVSADEQAKALTRLYPGDDVRLRVAGGDELVEVRYELSESRTLAVARTPEGGYRSDIIEHPLERRLSRSQGVIEHSLFVDGATAGLNDRLIMELAGIFGWDVDFALDIRRGDRFAVVYEELYRDGEKIRNGNIIAAEFVNQGKRYRAVRYTDPGGDAAYYAPDGRSMRKAFLRTPVNFAYVSSNFNPKRLHPILGKKRPHMGTDYAARVGTPIKAAGDGRIIHLGRKGGYGRCIIIKHGARYTTLYGHMSGYRKGLRNGDRVKQGQVIGYVGQSGLATGPHLHYEFRIDGVHRNPRTVKLPEADPIPTKLLADFKATAAPRLKQLDSMTDTRLATAREE